MTALYRLCLLNTYMAYIYILLPGLRKNYFKSHDFTEVHNYVIDVFTISQYSILIVPVLNHFFNIALYLNKCMWPERNAAFFFSFFYLFL